MMMHIGDAVESTAKTVLQDKAAALLGTLLLASDVTGPSDGTPTVAETLEELAAFDRHHAGFRLVEEHEELFQKMYENLETRVAAESESYIHAIRFDFLLGVGTTDAERANHLEGSCSQGAATQVEILG